MPRIMVLCATSFTVTMSVVAAGWGQSPSPIGDWTGPGGVIRVAPCATGPTLCVVVKSGNDGKNSMADIVGETVVKDMVSSGTGRWQGRYVADGKDLVATITLKNPNLAEMQVCLLSWLPCLLCETPSYTRIVP